MRERARKREDGTTDDNRRSDLLSSTAPVATSPTSSTTDGPRRFTEKIVKDYTQVHAEIQLLEQDVDQITFFSEVFGVNVKIPQNYTPRADVDDALVSAINRRKHVIIHGSSKQGKTCLRKKHLGDDKGHVSLICASNWSLADLHLQILKAAGYRQVRQEIVTSNKNMKAGGRIAGKVQIFSSLEVNAEASTEAGRFHQVERTMEPFTLDPTDANDVIAALRDAKFEKIVILEDFHYLQPTTQRDFSVALKAYHDSEQVQVVIVGVWLDRDRLIRFNGDLSGRIESINVDNWTKYNLEEVIKTGAEIIGVDFDRQFCDELIRESRGNVWIVQEICYAVCQRSGIMSDQSSNRRVLGEGFDVRSAISDIVEPMSSRFERMIALMSENGRSQADVNRWIIAAVLVSDVDQLAMGIPRSDLRAFIDRNRSEPPVDEGPLTRALNSLAQRQSKYDVRPIVLDYDRGSGRINVVDRSFLIWLGFKQQDMRSILEEAQLPAAFIKEAQARARETGRHSRPSS
ncbi:hypothetical protein [Actinophytocola xanthii]|uniref:hypothetical protein n=1 Tax=Actinophytocola xanthii TaxID=1912961 RepID=UPI00117867BA|nr:hypothetical protein [Actinophytocola xanthii]